jgi:hypothetical protein
VDGTVEVDKDTILALLVRFGEYQIIEHAGDQLKCIPYWTEGGPGSSSHPLAILASPSRLIKANGQDRTRQTSGANS